MPTKTPNDYAFKLRDSLENIKIDLVFDGEERMLEEIRYKESSEKRMALSTEFFEREKEIFHAIVRRAVPDLLEPDYPGQYFGKDLPK